MKRTLVMFVVLVLVLGGGLVALWLGERHAPVPPPAVANESVPVTRPPAPPPPAMPGPSSPPEQPSDRDSGILDGRIIDGMTHDGIPNAELTFVGDRGVATFQARRDGSFELTPSTAGSYTLASITAPGFLPYAPPVGFSAAQVTLARGHAVHGVTLRLYPAVDYEGTVVNARGAPVPDVRVRLLGPPGAEALEAAPEWKTGSDGHFTFQAADGAVLEAHRGAVRGWAQVDRSVVIMKKLTIRLGHAPPRDATITGWVRDAGGAPLADAVVRAAPSNYTTLPLVLATTGPDGRFTLAGVERVAYDVSAEAADHLRATRESVRGGSRDVALTLDVGLPLAGEVVDQRGELVSSYTLIVQQHVGAARARVATWSVIDPQGRFAVRVARGDYDLIAFAPGQPRSAVQAVAGSTDVRIVLGSATILRGKVISSDDGTPISDAFVGLEAVRSGLNTSSVLPITATRGDGTFELEGLAPGPVGIEVYARGRVRWVEELPPANERGVRDPITIELDPSAPDRARDVIGIGVRFVHDGDALRIVAVMPGSGALDAGVTDGDLIVAVDDLAVATLGLDGAMARIRGLAGTTVTLTLRRDGRDRRLAVERRKLAS